MLAATGRRDAAPPVAATEDEVDLVTGNWPAALDEARGDLVATWSDPATWTGTVLMGGPDALPAKVIGGMVPGGSWCCTAGTSAAPSTGSRSGRTRS